MLLAPLRTSAVLMIAFFKSSDDRGLIENDD